jgi:hypothetical protein
VTTQTTGRVPTASPGTGTARRAGLGSALRVEVRKTLSTRMWWILLLVMAAYVAVIAAFLAVAFSAGSSAGVPNGGQPSLDDPSTRLLLYTLAMPLAYVFPVLAGTLSITTEYRYKTLTYTFLAEPRRAVVLVAKLVVGTLMGLLFGVVAMAANAVAVAPVLAGTGHDVGLGGDVWEAMARCVVGMGLWAALGVGVGVVLRNQVAAMVVVIAFSQLVEPLLRFGLAAWEGTRPVSKFMPGAAGDAIAGASIYTTGTPTELLSWWQGGLVLAAYAAVLWVAGSLATVRRDVA